MPKVQVINMNGENISEVELNEEILEKWLTKLLQL